MIKSNYTSYGKYPNLYEILKEDFTTKIMHGIILKKFDHLDFNCDTCTGGDNGVCMYRG